MRDPSTETWRAALGQSTSAQLHDALAEAAELTTLLAEARTAERDIRAANERNLERLDHVRGELAKVIVAKRLLEADNRRLEAELGSARGALNELRGAP